MRTAIRMISLATTFFWVFLIGFFISAVYSVKDVRFDFGEPQWDFAPDNKPILSIPIIVQNNGYYDIGSFYVSTIITCEDYSKIAEGNTVIDIIPKGILIETVHNITMEIDDLVQESQDFLFYDTVLRVQETVGLKLADVIPVQASTNSSVPWGAPLYNFSIGETQYARLNMSHVTLNIPVSFENHAFYELNGDLELAMYNYDGTFIGRGITEFDALPEAPYQGSVELSIPTDEIPPNAYFEVYFHTSLFNFGPLVIPLE